MKLLLVHRNLRDRSAVFARAAAATPGNEVVVLTGAGVDPVPGARVLALPFPVDPAVPETPPATIERAARIAETAALAASSLKREGFRPDLMTGPGDTGETHLLKEVWPDVPLLAQFAFHLGDDDPEAGLDPEFPSPLDAVVPRRLLNATGLLGLESADWGWTTSERRRLSFPERRRSRMSVIPEGVDCREFAPNPRTAVRLPDGSVARVGDEIVTLAAPTLGPTWGFHVLARALPEILRRRPEARVFIVGDDEIAADARDGRTFRETVMNEPEIVVDRGRVHFQGSLPRRQLTAVLQVSAVHVHLTRPLAPSTPLLEAMAAGCLVVASPEADEVIRDGENGLSVDFRDPARLADRVVEALENPDRAAKLRARARAHVVERHDTTGVHLPVAWELMCEIARGRFPTPGPRAVPARPAAEPARGAFSVADALELARRAKSRGDLAEAERIYRELIAQRPRLHEAHYDLGLLLHGTGHHPQAITHLTEAIRIAPDVSGYHADLGVLLKTAERLDKRLDHYERALALDPARHTYLTNLGAALGDLGRVDEAEAACRRALVLSPEHPPTLINLASALVRRNRLDEAIDLFRRAARGAPDDPVLNGNLGMCLMLRGDLVEGTERYEHRLRTGEIPSRDFPRPAWNGEPLDGRTILLHAEQGLGDTFHYCRYIPLVRERGGRVIVEAHRSQVELLRGVDGVERVAALGDPLPAFDVHCPLLSLMRVFRTDLNSIPRNVPYLRPDPARVDAWAERPRRRPGVPLVALVWAGSPTHRNDHNRSLSLAMLKPRIEAASDVDFISLQVGPSTRQIAENGLTKRLPDMGAEVRDFSDTAAILSRVDLLISVDTSIVHLAGALGRPVWTLLPFAPDWRWLLDRDDSPWYPSMTLFRQDADARWEPVVERVFASLKASVREGGGVSPPRGAG